jgi:hypothetical protein
MNTNSTQNHIPLKPSIHFCKTGELEKVYNTETGLFETEKYNQNIHIMGKTPDERCSKFYNKSEYSGGKRGTQYRKKKSRKNKKKTRRYRK